MATHEFVSRRGFLKISGIGFATAYLAGCSVGGGDAGKADDALRAAFTQPVTSLDPHDVNSAVDEAALLARRLVFDTLTKREGDEVKGSLAKSWEQESDTTWVFELRDDVTFHDGSALTAKDVKASLEHIKSLTTPQSPLWDPVAKVQASGEHQVTITTKSPMGTLPVNLTLLFIVPAAKVGDKEFFRKPVGSGPYEVKAFTPSSTLELTRAAKHWGGKGKSATIELPFIKETSSAVTSLSNGEVDLLWPIPPDQVTEVEGGDGVAIERVDSWVYYFSWFNCGRKPFVDPRVRRAMWHAVDVASIVRDLFGEGAKPMDAPIPSTVFGHAKQEPYAYDVDKARALLKEAGHAGGFSTSLMWFDATGPLARQLAQALISAWDEIGVKVEGQSIQKAEWLERLNSLDWDMELQTNTVTTGDADFTLGRLYTSKANRLGYENAELDDVLGKAAESADKAEREELYGQACRIIWSDAPGIFPAGIVTAYGMRDGVTGFEPAPSNQPDLSAVTVSG